MARTPIKYLDAGFVWEIEQAPSRVPGAGTEGLATKALKPAAAVFSENLRRIVDLAKLPLALGFYGPSRARIFDGVNAALRTARREGADESAAVNAALASAHRQPTHFSWNSTEASSVVAWACQKDSAVRNGVSVLFASMLIGAWTAFETLATDLWIAAVGLRPRPLGINALCSSVRGDDIKGESDGPRTISIDVLRECDFQIGPSLARVLHARQHFHFNTLQGLRLAYTETFLVGPEGNERKSSAVEKWFTGEKRHEQLSALEAMRNLLVHQGGRVDDPFLKRVQSSPTLASLAVKDLLPLDRDLVKEHVLAAQECAIRLLREVDTWMDKLRPH